MSTLTEVRRCAYAVQRRYADQIQKEFCRVDIYRLLGVPAPAAIAPAQAVTSLRDAKMPGMTDPRPRPTTQFTESIESTDEERSGALLGSVAP